MLRPHAGVGHEVHLVTGDIGDVSVLGIGADESIVVTVIPTGEAVLQIWEVFLGVQVGRVGEVVPLVAPLLLPRVLLLLPLRLLPHLWRLSSLLLWRHPLLLHCICIWGLSLLTCPLFLLLLGDCDRGGGGGLRPKHRHLW